MEISISSKDCAVGDKFYQLHQISIWDVCPADIYVYHTRLEEQIFRYNITEFTVLDAAKRVSGRMLQKTEATKEILIALGINKVIEPSLLPEIKGLLSEFWQQKSDSCPLECTEAEKQEEDFAAFVEAKKFSPLIAAAPELLEALEALYEEIGSRFSGFDLMSDDLKIIMQKANAAIKAVKQ